MLRKALILAAALGLAAAHQASAEVTQAPLKEATWSFEGPFGHFDQEQLQRGYKVYHDVCSACHSMNLMSYRNLGQLGGPFYDPKWPNPNDNLKVKAIAKDFNVPDIDGDTGDVIKRPATPADTFVKPFPNEAAARASNGGALPPDLSLIAKAREDGPRYIYSLLTGYVPAPAGLRVPAGKYYNPYMPGDLGSFWSGKGEAPKGGFIAMPLQLTDDRVTYDDGVKATADQEAKDVVAFLMWASEPHADERKQTGYAVMIFLFLFAGLVYASYRKLWKDIDHG
ncbi:cytochrome c1 [Phenylobacterium montanum]|uniref:Cytochrome c1 n=1 Tax=Phenylobacterium montanum TaxID=2823693 RepID=A0A975FYD6_9CAUL|nr:cytochrome c1 [Caulobacter sp. S6]QUD87249.1 cytochrome c1 [Caulobacter sp. S6]